MITIHESLTKPGYWVANCKYGGFVQADGTIGMPVLYTTPAEAQIAKDLYLAKLKLPQEIRQFIGHPGGELEIRGVDSKGTLGIPCPQSHSHKYDPPIRMFGTGATRDTNTGKLDYEAFNNPLVDKRYAKYLHKHRKQSDGQMRDGDNWQKLFGEHHTDVCIKSLCRHIVDARLAHRDYQNEQPLEDSLCAIIFNAKAYLLKLLLDKQPDRTEPVDGGY